MGKTRGVHETTPELRNRMVGMYEAGLGLREIAAAVNCSQRTVKRWLNRFDKEGTVETRERCGRKRATTEEQDEAIIRLATQTPITAAKAVLPVLGLTCSVDTIRERLHKAGIHNWSPSRKYMQRIPLGDTDGAAVQQPVWRPTGTQLGKRKSSKGSNKNEKNNVATKKKNVPRKIRAKYVYVGDGAPAENQKSSSEQEEFIYSQQNAPQSHAGEMQTVSQSLQPGQTDFASDTALTQQQTQQPVYHQHPALNISQSWPLDLVQGTNHYTQGQPNSISHEQTNTTHHLQDLHSQQQEQQRQQQQHHHHHHHHHQQQHHQQHHQHHHQHHHVQQVQQTIIMDQTHNLEQQGHLQPEAQQQNQHDHLNAQLATPQASTNLASDNSNACASQDNQSSSVESDQNDETSKEGCANSEAHRKKKKGGKAKGTLETSVEIRNRMIGMSEAGLSTLSIALAIDRSERTVKRWLERWQKEGNVQTKERKGRRRITTKEEDEAIITMATQQPLTAAKHVAPALGLKCSVDTIRERLHKAGIHSWKLGKKQGEGNAVHTVHLWQPSGNRPNKPKLPGEKRRKSNGNRKRNQALSNAKKRSTIRKKKAESASVKIVSQTTNIMSEQTAVVSFHNPGTSTNAIQSVQNIPAPPPTVIQTLSHPSAAPPQAAQSVQQIGSMMQQRPDCRLAPAIVAPVSVQGNAAVAYPSCMVVATNANTGQMEQPDPLNYEPYIWTF